MKDNLNKLENRLSMQIGDNYLKRAFFYIVWSVIGLLICITGIVCCNTQVSIKEIIAFKFTLDVPRIKEIITYISATGLVLSFCMLIYSIGLKKKKNEEVSQVKQYLLHNFLYLIKKQHGMLQEFPSVDAPKELFLQYIVIAYELKSECDKGINLFGNLLTTLELNTIRQLQTSVDMLVHAVGIDEAEINQYTPNSFNMYFAEKKTSAPQYDKINEFTYGIKKEIERYSEQIKICFEEFKCYIE